LEPLEPARATVAVSDATRRSPKVRKRIATDDTAGSCRV
jgi:hypothetical protein